MLGSQNDLNFVYDIFIFLESELRPFSRGRESVFCKTICCLTNIPLNAQEEGRQVKKKKM